MNVTIEQLQIVVDELKAQNEVLRAELAAAKENYNQHIRHAVHIADELRAKLAAEQNRYKDLLQSWAEVKELRDAARAELAAATADRDRVAAINVRHCETVNSYVVMNSKLEAERNALRAQLDEAREALEPMRWWNEKWDALTDGDIVSLRFYIEELRRARAVLEKIKGGGDE